jgi:hypothetical protein
VQKNIIEEKVILNQYLILKFDFSAANHNSNMIVVDQAFKRIISLVFKKFYDEYTIYLGKDAA